MIETAAEKTNPLIEEVMVERGKNTREGGEFCSCLADSESEFVTVIDIVGVFIQEGQAAPDKPKAQA